MLCDHSTPYNSHLFVLPQRLRRLYPTDEKAVPVDACLRCYRHVTAYAGIVHAQQHLNLMQARLRSTSCQVTTCCQLSKEETIRSTEALDGTLEQTFGLSASHQCLGTILMRTRTMFQQANKSENWQRGWHDVMS
jgi:hypothetical protein